MRISSGSVRYKLPKTGLGLLPPRIMGICQSAVRATRSANAHKKARS